MVGGAEDPHQRCGWDRVWQKLAHITTPLQHAIEDRPLGGRKGLSHRSSLEPPGLLGNNRPGRFVRIGLPWASRLHFSVSFHVWPGGPRLCISLSTTVKS